MRHINYLLMSVLLIFTLAACTTMQPVKENSTTEEIVKEIKPGDRIRLVTKTGDQHLMIVSWISEGYIFGKEESFKIEDIEIIDVERLNAAGQVGAVVGGIGVAVLMQALIFAIVLAVAL